MSEIRPFLFGKLPAFGDFLSRGLPAASQGAWDQRCTATIQTTSERAGEAFSRIIEELPPRGFLLEPGQGETYWQVGCATFSRDRIGRPFLFVLGMAGGRRLRDDGDWIAASLEPCLYDAFLNHRAPAAILDAAIDAIGERRPVKATGWMLMRGWQADWAAA